MTSVVIEVRKCARSAELNRRIAAVLLEGAENAAAARSGEALRIQQRAGYHVAFAEMASQRAFDLVREASR